MKKLKQKKAFTLVELIVVIVIIGILAAVLVPSLTSYIEKANMAKAKLNAKTAHTSILSKTFDPEYTYLLDEDFIYVGDGYAILIEKGAITNCIKWNNNILFSNQLYKDLFNVSTNPSSEQKFYILTYSDNNKVVLSKADYDNFNLEWRIVPIQ